jgi:hypothetical protein
MARIPNLETSSRPPVDNIRLTLFAFPDPASLGRIRSWAQQASRNRVVGNIYILNIDGRLGSDTPGTANASSRTTPVRMPEEPESVDQERTWLLPQQTRRASRLHPAIHGEGIVVHNSASGTRKCRQTLHLTPLEGLGESKGLDNRCERVDEGRKSKAVVWCYLLTGCFATRHDKTQGSRRT